LSKFELGFWEAVYKHIIVVSQSELGFWEAVHKYIYWANLN